jgi:hypothetical protein
MTAGERDRGRVVYDVWGPPVRVESVEADMQVAHSFYALGLWVMEQGNQGRKGDGP